MGYDYRLNPQAVPVADRWHLMESANGGDRRQPAFHPRLGISGSDAKRGMVPLTAVGQLWAWATAALSSGRGKAAHSDWMCGRIFRGLNRPVCGCPPASLSGLRARSAGRGTGLCDPVSSTATLTFSPPCLHSRLRIDLVADHQSPDRPRHLVGQRDHHVPWSLDFPQRFAPCILSPEGGVGHRRRWVLRFQDRWDHAPAPPRLRH